jgi:hypothetical protein
VLRFGEGPNAEKRKTRLRHSGRVSFGYFSLHEQRESTPTAVLHRDVRISRERRRRGAIREPQVNFIRRLAPTGAHRYGAGVEYLVCID